MFDDREDAGNKLCLKLKKFFGKKDTLVVGLTRGGVVTAKTISDSLNLPLKILVVKKIGAPDNEELAIGAIVNAKNVYWNEGLCKELNIQEKEKKYLLRLKEKEVAELYKFLKVKLTPLDFRNKTIILVDDGVATGASVISASNFLRQSKAKKIILAIPVIASDTLIDIKKYFDGIIYLNASRDFFAVGEYYKNFQEISSAEVASLLATSH